MLKISPEVELIRFIVERLLDYKEKGFENLSKLQFINWIRFKGITFVERKEGKTKLGFYEIWEAIWGVLRLRFNRIRP